MSRIKSKKYEGIYLNKLTNGDISYSIVFKNEKNKTQRITIGKKSQGITEQYCNNKRTETINYINLGEQPLAIRKKRGEKVITLEEVAQKYFENMRRRSSQRCVSDTFSKYKKNLRSLSELNITQITKQDLREIQKKMEDLSYAPKTINQTIGTFSAIYNYGLKEEMYVGFNPASKLEKYNTDNTRDRYLSNDEILQLIEEVRHNDQLLLFVKLALTTGARLQGILSIQKKDINLSTGMINLNDFKTKSTYKSFLTAELVKLLKERVLYFKPNDYIFTVDGKNMTCRQLQRRLKPVLDELFNEGLSLKDTKNRVVIHSLRHTFASHLAINGTPIYTIQRLMNHNDINMTLRYAKLSPESGRDNVNMLYM